MSGKSNQPIVFQIRYCPYQLPNNSNKYQKKKHEKERKFFSLSGSYNLYSYMTMDAKLNGEYTALQYFEKNAGVFDDKDYISEQALKEMKKRAKANKGNIWHGFISFNKENSYKIDTPEKCMNFMKRVFGVVFDEMHVKREDFDLMCALHVDREIHYHIHFSFWEKTPKYIGVDGEKNYRRKGTVPKRVIDNFAVRSGLFVEEEKEHLYNTRKEAIRALRGMTAIRKAMTSSDEIKNEFIALAQSLPKEGRLSYGSKEMEPYRERVDKIVKLLLDYDGEARKADREFYEQLDKLKLKVGNIIGKPYAFTNKNVKLEDMLNNLPKYHFNIDEKNIHIIEKVEADYKRRQGNLVLNLAKIIKPEYYERKKNEAYKVNDKKLKKKMSISQKNIHSLLCGFFSSFGNQSRLLERDFSNRLQEIEEEIKKEQEKNKKEENKKE